MKRHSLHYFRSNQSEREQEPELAAQVLIQGVWRLTGGYARYLWSVPPLPPDPLCSALPAMDKKVGL